MRGMIVFFTDFTSFTVVHENLPFIIVCFVITGYELQQEPVAVCMQGDSAISLYPSSSFMQFDIAV